MTYLDSIRVDTNSVINRRSNVANLAFGLRSDPDYLQGPSETNSIFMNDQSDSSCAKPQKRAASCGNILDEEPPILHPMHSFGPECSTPVKMFYSNASSGNKVEAQEDTLHSLSSFQLSEQEVYRSTEAHSSDTLNVSLETIMEFKQKVTEASDDDLSTKSLFSADGSAVSSRLTSPVTTISPVTSLRLNGWRTNEDTIAQEPQSFNGDVQQTDTKSRLKKPGTRPRTLASGVLERLVHLSKTSFPLRLKRHSRNAARPNSSSLVISGPIEGSFVHVQSASNRTSTLLQNSVQLNGNDEEMLREPVQEVQLQTVNQSPSPRVSPLIAVPSLPLILPTEGNYDNHHLSSSLLELSLPLWLMNEEDKSKGLVVNDGLAVATAILSTEANSMLVSGSASNLTAQENAKWLGCRANWGLKFNAPQTESSFACRFYFEVMIMGKGPVRVGYALQSTSLNLAEKQDETPDSFLYETSNTGSILIGSRPTTHRVSGCQINDVIGVHLDLSRGLIYWTKNGELLLLDESREAYIEIPSSIRQETFYPICFVRDSSLLFNFGDTPFSHGTMDLTRNCGPRWTSVTCSAKTALSLEQQFGSSPFSLVPNNHKGWVLDSHCAAQNLSLRHMQLTADCLTVRAIRNYGGQVSFFPDRNQPFHLHEQIQVIQYRA
ncbi:DEAD (Asp-Glu-Ala-Asp) box helicase 1 [Cichlidogyrus casuarinus]|uniref:DEAD (Asp-Glu-Ala-Asp) box helicase 1 n=1 Tax=Cichlidogyrus casuarinus TaxID=1844966 RepID=A0ABD2QLS9_9PLAT